MADDPIHIGVAPPYYNHDAITFTRKVGRTVESSALVLLRDLEVFLAPLQQKNFSYQVSPHTGTPYALVSWIPYDATNVVSIIWEIAANDIEKDIWELPKVRTEFTKLINAPGTVDSSSPGNQFYQWHAFVQRVVNGKVNGDADVPEWHYQSDGTTINKIKIFTPDEFDQAFVFLNSEAGLPDSGHGIAVVDKQVFKDLAACLSRGVTSFPEATWAFRKTQILPPGFNLGPSPMVPNTIYTRAQLINGAFPPLEIQPLMPAGYYQYKSPPLIAQRDGTWQLTEEWYYAKDFDHFVYGNFGSVGP